jgi:CRISPR-associated protein Csb3
MSTSPNPGFRIRVDVTNPGQFFACCGLFELANRLNPEAKAWFADAFFFVTDSPQIKELIGLLREVRLVQIDPDDNTASPIEISAPFSLRLDWWKSRDRADSALKIWAGTMESFRIARGMQNALRADAFASEDLLNTGMVAYDPDAPDKKVEPFYFDARRGPNAHPRDVGFAPNDLSLTTIASPAVELLCLIGLQRTRPVRTEQPRVFDYYSWQSPLPATLTQVAVAGLLPGLCGSRYRFESWFRTGQRKHKAFLSAKLINP